MKTGLKIGQPVKARSESVGQQQVPALDFEAISQIWGSDENLLFDSSPSWPWGRSSEDGADVASAGGSYDNFGRSHSTEVTVRAAVPERQKFSSSF